jgi:hypothetical protein
MLQVTPALSPSFVTVLKRSRVPPGQQPRMRATLRQRLMWVPTPLFVGSAAEVAMSCTLGLCEAREESFSSLCFGGAPPPSNIRMGGAKRNTPQSLPNVPTILSK